MARLLQRFAEESGLEPMRAQQGEQVLDLGSPGQTGRDHRRDRAPRPGARLGGGPQLEN